MGSYTSPGTPDYKNAGETAKGWFSERVPLPSTSKHHIGASALMPFNSRRIPPSKWDDAERWITNPISGSGVNKNLFVQPQRRPKSKSGPQAGGCFSNYSPAEPVLQGGSVRDFTVGPPFSTGVLVPDYVQFHYGSANGGLVNQVKTGGAMDSAVSFLGWSDALTESSEPSSQDDKFEGVKDSETTISRDVSRRDMATQMSPKESQSSSPKRRLSFSISPPFVIPSVSPHNSHSSRVEVKDLQVDNTATMTRRSKKNGTKKTKNNLPDVKVVTSSWKNTGTSKNISKLQREEAKINAWESLQKAKAEAAIEKLEMKLEKQRSISMDKILNKLRIAQLKAQDIRNSMPDSTSPRVKTSYKPTFFCMFPISSKGKKR